MNMRLYIWFFWLMYLSNLAHIVMGVQPGAKTSPSRKRYVLDEIKATVNGLEQTKIFCTSDLKRKGIDGKARTLKDLVEEILIYWQALHFKIPLNKEVIDAYIYKIRQQFNLSLDDIKAIFSASGYDYEEGLKAFEIMYANNMMKENLILRDLLITEEEVVKYFNEHPIVKEQAYYLQIAFISCPFDQKETIKKELEQYALTAKGMTISWRDAFWLKKSELASHLTFITTMNPGEISKPFEVPGGFEIYRLVKSKEERLVPLKKRYRQIVDILRRPKFEQKYAHYRKTLFESVSISYFNIDPIVI